MSTDKVKQPRREVGAIFFRKHFSVHFGQQTLQAMKIYNFAQIFFVWQKIFRHVDFWRRGAVFDFDKKVTASRIVVHKGRVITGLTSIFGNDNITPLLNRHENFGRRWAHANHKSVSEERSSEP